MAAVRILFSTDEPEGRVWAPLMRKMVRHTLRSVRFAHPCEVSLRITDDQVIRELNRDYRHIDAATDVLSFSMLEGDGPPAGEEAVLLGDVVISLETAARRAGRQGVPLETEMALLTAHGILHLLGYDHHSPGPRRVMRRHEGDALQRAGFDPTVVERPRS